MPKNLWPVLAKGSAGFVLALLFWWVLSAPYARLLSLLTEPLIRMTESPAVTRLTANGNNLVIDRTDFPRSSPRPELLLMDLTSNFIVLGTLFAVNRQPLRDRNIGRFVLASLALMAVHVAAVAVNVQSIYALALGAWSEKNYGPLARNFWGASAHFYTVIGVFGAAFALWWLFRPPLDAGNSKFNRYQRGNSVYSRQ